jgi:hypothetical protein
MAKVEFSKSDIKIIRLIWGIGLVLVLTFFLVIHLSQETTGWELYYKNKSEKEYKGRVINKYIDYKDHAIKKIVLDNNITFNLISTEWYNQFDTGDFVLKEKGSVVIKLIKNNNQDTLYFDYRDIEIKE